MPSSGTSQPLPRLAPETLHAFLDDLFGEEFHHKQVLSLSYGVLAVLHAAHLAVRSLGKALAKARGLQPKHATKQIDRLLSNEALPLPALFKLWIPFVLGPRKEIVVALDWTDFEKDDHTTLALYLITSHGRATPLCWKTVKKSELAGKRYQYESELLALFDETVPEEVRITLLADRGFGDQERYDFLDLYGWDYVIRFRCNILVTNQKGETKPAKEWLPPSGRATKLPGARVCAEKTEVGAVVVVRAPGMKDAWFLATNRGGLSAAQVVGLYSKRFKIEETFRDTKDPHFGMGLSATHIKKEERRDRLLLLLAMGYALLVLLGAAGEQCGLDSGFKSSPKSGRVLSLYNQGKFWYEAMPNLPEMRRKKLLAAYEKELRRHAFIRTVFGVL